LFRNEDNDANEPLYVEEALEAIAEDAKIDNFFDKMSVAWGDQEEV
jgi:hypothetical protein